MAENSHKGCHNLPEPLSEDLALKELITKAYYLYSKSQNSNLKFRNKKIVVDKNKSSCYLWDKTFDHLITEEAGGIRVYSKERLRTLLWMEEILINCYHYSCPKLRINRILESSKPKYKLECPIANYCVILGRRRKTNDYLLITAYPLEEVKEKELIKK